MRYQGFLYRAIEPVWAAEPLSGEGAKLHGGRFNPPNVSAFYSSLTPMTAVRESDQADVPIQPTTLVSYRADISPVFDATQPENLTARNINLDYLAAADWWNRMKNDGKAPTQIFAEQLIAEGYAGLKAPSFVSGAEPEDVNIILWKWGPDLPAQLTVNDQDNRLRRLAERMAETPKRKN
ncbi:MAG: RES family NAD+ phosphorylase [Rhodospirillales bacterium]